MKVSELSKTDLKTMSYTDIAYLIIKEGKTLNTASLFRRICDLLEYTDAQYSAKIGDFYTSLTTDSRFLFLSNAEWDLRDNHVVKIEIDEDEEDEEEIEDYDDETSEDEEEEATVDEDEEDLDAVKDEDVLDDDVEDDDMEDLSIVDEEESV